jgi:hypothetical protein
MLLGPRPLATLVSPKNGLTWGSAGAPTISSQNQLTIPQGDWTNTTDAGNSQIGFVIPNQATPGTNATVQVTTLFNGKAMVSNTATLSINYAPPAISSLMPSVGVAPGDTIVIRGSNFGEASGGYITFNDNGLNWGSSGAPASSKSLQSNSWSPTQISFVVPANQTQPGSTATVTVTTASGASNLEQLSLGVGVTGISPSVGLVPMLGNASGTQVTISLFPATGRGTANRTRGLLHR